MADLIKHSGQVYTPDYLVNFILDEAGYSGEAILNRHCIDNSCGDGAFLCEVVRRYSRAYVAAHGTTDGLARELEEYIHGVEIDKEAWRCCLDNLESVGRELGIGDCSFDVTNEDTMEVRRFDSRMDYVVGNPPYVRVHNLEDKFDRVKSFKFSGAGMTDLYLVFFEIGMRMLNEEGRLCYITPSSWLNSVAGQNMRRYILSERNLVSVTDLGHFQPFKATTYTMISLFRKDYRGNDVDYSVYEPRDNSKVHVDSITFSDLCVNGCFYLANNHILEMLRSTFAGGVQKYVSVKNGFATLADKVFISDGFPFDEYTIPVIKASTGRWCRALYPYDSEGRPLPREQVFASEAVGRYLLSRKDELLKGADESDNPLWYVYGRSQALKDVARDKIAINTCIKDIASIKLNLAPAGHGVYSGLYILTDIPYGKIEELVCSQDFISYIASLKKYKSGGYYTFSSKDLEAYLNFKLNQIYGDESTKRTISHQRRFSQRSFEFV